MQEDQSSPLPPNLVTPVTPPKKGKSFLVVLMLVLALQAFALAMIALALTGDSEGWGTLGKGILFLIFAPVLLLSTIASIALSFSKSKNDTEESPRRIFKVISGLLSVASIVALVLVGLASTNFLQNAEIVTDKKGRNETDNSIVENAPLNDAVYDVTKNLSGVTQPIPATLDTLTLSSTTKQYVADKTITYTANTKPSVLMSSSTTASGTMKQGYYFYEICVNYPTAYTNPNDSKPETDSDGYITSTFTITSHTAEKVCYKLRGIGAIQ